ncbi:ATP-binding protein [Streptomyces daliensis]|uniref:ATP-binding protein n=1 Tax=Streptomyces daliensis TaxID=299421 RepID=A0A8T4J5V1_9ACTN|nr:ATP-binding protein [Streptomyces daliensis]
MIMTATKPNVIGVPGYSQEMCCTPEAAGHARQLVETALSTWSLGHLIEDGSLIISELVGNAAQHSGGLFLCFGVSLPAPYRVRFAVSDTSAESPTLHRPGPGRDEESGRGLFIVHELAHRWGSEYWHSGKVVWAELLSAEEDS